MAVNKALYSLEAEEALLGNIILFNDSLRECIDSDLVSEDFYLEKNRIVYQIMCYMYESNEKVDSVSLSTKLRDFNQLDKVGGMEYILRLSESTIYNRNVKEYINIIKNKSVARKLIKVGEEISNDAVDTTRNINDLLDEVERKVIDVTRSNLSNDFVSGEQAFDELIKHIETIQENKSEVTGVRTLYSALDKMTAGLQKGDLIIVAARPSMGKTTFALNLALNSASVNQGSVAIFSVEMPREQVAMRLLSSKSKVEYQKIRRGTLNNEEWSRINEATQVLKKQNFFIDDTPGIKVTDMLAKARKLAKEEGLYLIIVDYIQLLQSSTSSENRQQEVSDISRRLKALARELNVPVIAVSQLHRGVESRQDKRPMLSDLRESGALEQDADLVMFLYRDDYYKREEGVKNEREDVELIIAKHRNGPTGKITLAFEKEIFAFYGIKNDVKDLD